MEKRDLIEDQIEQLSKFLKNILANLFNLKSSSSPQEKINFVSKSLKEKFELDLNQIISLSKEEFESFLVHHKFNENQIESLSKTFFELYLIDKKNTDKREKFLLKSIELLDLADMISNAFSIERNKRKTEYANLINKL